METKQKKSLTPDAIFAWLKERQEYKKQKQLQFQRDCESGKIKELLKNAKPAFWTIYTIHHRWWIYIYDGW